MNQDTLVELSKVYNTLLEVEVKGNSVMILAAVMANLKNIIDSEQKKLIQSKDQSNDAFNNESR